MMGIGTPSSHNKTPLPILIILPLVDRHRPGHDQWANRHNVPEGKKKEARDTWTPQQLCVADEHFIGMLRIMYSIAMQGGALATLSDPDGPMSTKAASLYVRRKPACGRGARSSLN